MTTAEANQAVVPIMNQATSTLLSLDLPWATEGFVGASLAVVRGATEKVSVVSVATRRHQLPSNLKDVEDFVSVGARASSIVPMDSLPPLSSFPTNSNDRRNYLEGVYGALLDVRAKLEFDGQKSVDVAAIDMPFVPDHVSSLSPPTTPSSFCYRPVENAFGSKAWIPCQPKAQQFPRFQGGIIFGCRPGYAVASLVQHVFGATVVVESFPQLTIGSLCEMGAAAGLPRPVKLAAHKTGNVTSKSAAQATLLSLIEAWCGYAPQWRQSSLTLTQRIDGIDALLGLLPLLALSRSSSNATAALPRWFQPVFLLNLGGPSRPPVPIRRHKNQPLFGTQAWLSTTPQLRPGVNDGGVLGLHLSDW